jgi:hypothetical protein
MRLSGRRAKDKKASQKAALFEKSAQKLLLLYAVPVETPKSQLTKVFCFFFSKKKLFLNVFRRSALLGLRYPLA